MNKTISILATVMTSASMSLAQIYLTDTNIVGDVGDIYAFANTVANPVIANNATILGISGVTVVTGTVTSAQDVTGQNAFRNIGSYNYFTNSTITGGDGGSITVEASTGTLTANGSAVTMVGNASDWNFVNTTVTAGDGGTISASSNVDGSSANGGLALLYAVPGATVINASGSTFRGGDGGTFITGSGSTAVANGGNSLEIRSSATINGGTFIGGKGGKAVGNENSTATGGAGLYLTTAESVTINGGTFTAGAGGTVGDADGADGAAVEVNDSVLTIAGGTLNGDILFSGGDSTLSLTGSFTDDVIIVQTAGTATIDMWNEGQLDDVTIQDGTMNFDGQMFNLDGVFALESSTASASFNDGLTVANGATLDVGSGSVSGSSVLLESGSIIKSTYGGGGSNDLGQVKADNDLTLESQVTWNIYTGANAVSDGDQFVLATGNALTNNMLKSDIELIGTGFSSGWLGGIETLINDGMTLTATFGQSDIDEACDVAGDYSTEFGRAMNVLSDLLTAGSDGYNVISELANSADEGKTLMENSYVRTTEMGSALIGMQSVFNDQIKDRTRSKMRYDEVGYPSSSNPTGAGGWQPLRSFSERIEDQYGYDEVKNFVDDVVPDVSLDDTGLPVDWQAWGRAYGSSIEQNDKDSFAGYDATVGGGMIGVDKRIDNMLFGVGAGVARTDLEGYAGRDAEATTGHGVLYFSTHGDKAYIDASASYAFNAVEGEYDILGYESEFDAHTMGLYIGGGYGISLLDRVLLTPEASILNTLYLRESYTESSSLVGIPDLDYDSYDQWSHLMKVGATLNSIQKIDMFRWEMGFQPEVRAHWLREFNAEMDDETYSMGGATIGATPMAREEDLVQVGAGVRFSSWTSDATEIGIDVDGIFGDDYEAYILSGKIIHRF